MSKASSDVASVTQQSMQGGNSWWVWKEKSKY